MKKKIFLLVIIAFLMMPIGYASYLAFYPPKVVLEGNRDDNPYRRYNYKPWSGARPEPDMTRYSMETKRQFDKTKNAFDKSENLYESAIKAADRAATSYDRLIMDGF